MGTKRGWFRQRPSDDEMREELEAHVAMRAEHDGVDEAAARRRLGNVLRTREEMRRVWIARWWDALRQDAHYTWRSWRRRPAFAVAAILVLGLGIGASTALFAALDRVLFKPLPYPDPDRLVSVGRITVPLVFETQTESNIDAFYVQEWGSPPAPFQSMTAIAALVGPRTCETAEGLPEGLRCDLVEHNFLRVLGRSVALGRDFAPQDDTRGAPQVAIISHSLWVRRFGADPEVVNRTLSLDRAGSRLQARIIGVLPPDFEMPFETGDVLLPAQLRPIDPNSRFRSGLAVLARLRPDVTPDRARQMLESRWPKISQLPAGPGFREEWRVRPLRDRRFGGAARVAWLLMGAVAVFLLIACVNVTNLMLARVGERRREFGLRAAIGAGRTRLARLALAESLLLALAAGGMGLLVAFTLLETFVAMAPPGIPGVADASIDLRVFLVVALLVVITGTAIGLWPALSVLRVGELHGLRSTNPSSGARPRVRFALVTTQIALTLALLGGSALLLRSLWHVINVPLGFDADRVVTLTAALSPVRYPTGEHGAAFLEELFARAKATPRVESVAMSNAPPPPLLSSVRAPIELEGRPLEPNALRPPIRFRSVTPQYFETFRIPVVRGRTLQAADVGGEPAAAINESAERVLFAGERALGRRIRFPPPPNIPGFPLQLMQRPWYTVVGVIADVRNAQALTEAPNPEIYFAARPGRWVDLLPAGSRGVLSVRTTTSPSDAAAFLRHIAADLDPRQLVTIQTGDELLTAATAQPRFIAWLLTAFAALALLLAAAGLYSVASYLVLQRRRDIGVRMAVGASPREVAKQVVSEAARWIIAGAIAGAVLGWIGTRAMQSQLYEVRALDPWSWTGALLALAVVLVIAVFRPAYRAAHVDPVTALRSE
ncbi:MAG TPA: ADOP family duplicated permease [Vicinamibacterales bacterium]|jgi:predicted permease